MQSEYTAPAGPAVALLFHTPFSSSARRAIIDEKICGSCVQPNQRQTQTGVSYFVECWHTRKSHPTQYVYRTYLSFAVILLASIAPHIKQTTKRTPSVELHSNGAGVWVAWPLPKAKEVLPPCDKFPVANNQRTIVHCVCECAAWGGITASLTCLQKKS